ncbi:MAG TPA: gamma-glutamylcyclotransferase family protein [Thermoanaerobaculia bacterium]|nr:gamma-glutamylcyclotransferase family protein [Thermoanaerobaculia bacterium]
MPRPTPKPPTGPDYIFVYGTLRAASNHDMSRVLERHADFVSRGRIPGVLYDVGPYPGAVRRRGTRAFVWGDVYRLRDSEHALPILDRYEGWNEAKPRSAEFKRSRILVDLGGGKKVRAWIYLYNRPTTGLTKIRSGDYFGAAARPGRVSDKRR